MNKSRGVSPTILQLSLGLAACVLLLELFLMPYLLDDAVQAGPIDCNRLVASLQGSAKDGQTAERAADEVHRFSPHRASSTERDTDPALSTPQVFKIVSSATVERSRHRLTQHCQAVYTDIAAQGGHHYLEAPAHCFFRRGDTAALSSPLSAPLENFCVYAGEDLTKPDAVFTIEEISCKSVGHPQASYAMQQDSCIVALDRDVPDSIKDNPLRWWKPDANAEQSEMQQLMALLDVNSEELSCNIESGNTEADNALYMVSHSIDYDGTGLQRVVSQGRAIYSHAVNGVIMQADSIPNNIDTRSGDSGAPVFVYHEGEKRLVGIQVAIFQPGQALGRLLQDASADRQNYVTPMPHSASYLSRFNMAINPHLGSDTWREYRYHFGRNER